MIIKSTEDARAFIDGRVDGVNDDGWETDSWSQVGEDGVLRVGFMDWDTGEGATFRVTVEVEK